MRAVVVAISMVFVFVPGVVAGQTWPGASGSTDSAQGGREKLSLQVAGGPTIRGGASVISAGVGYSPASRVELLLNVERIHQPSRFHYFENGFSASRGGTLTFVSGELRVSFLPQDRVSPFALVGGGGGISRPNVNATFPEAVRNDLRVMYVGGGVRVPLRHGLSLVGDARAMLALEGYDGVLGILPVRAAITWRF